MAEEILNGYEDQDAIGGYADDREEAIRELEELRIKVDEEIEEPDYTLFQNGVGFAPKGNIIALMAEKKHGKTFVNTIVSAAILCGEYLGMMTMLKNSKVLFFDTEMDRYDGMRVQRRVQYINHWDFRHDDDYKGRFAIYHLREKSPEERIRIIEQAIDIYRPDVVIIDGIRDLLSDFNDIEESHAIIEWAMRITSDYHIAMWTVLHVNPNSEKMRGHLGTELGNKASDVFLVTRRKDKHAGLVTYELDHKDSRHRNIDGIEFKIDDSQHLGIPVLLNQDDTQAIEAAKEERVAEMRLMMKKYLHEVKSTSYTKLREKIKKDNHIGSASANKLIEEAVSCGVVIVEFGMYRLKPNSGTEENEQSALPF